MSQRYEIEDNDRNLVSLSGRTRIKVVNENRFDLNELVVRNWEIPRWATCETNDGSSGEEGSVVQRNFQDTVRTLSEDYGRLSKDTIVIQPALDQDKLVARTLVVRGPDLGGHYMPDYRITLSSKPFKDAAQAAQELSGPLDCQMTTNESRDEQPPAYEDPASPTSHTPEQELLRLFSAFLSRYVSKDLPQGHSSYGYSGRNPSPSVIVVGEQDFLNCLKVSKDDTSPAKEIQHIPEPNDRFGGDSFVWLDGRKGMYGNSGRLLVSVQNVSPAFNRPRGARTARISLAIPTERDGRTGVPAGVRQLTDLSTQLGAEVATVARTALDEFSSYYWDSRRSAMFQELIDGLEQYRGQDFDTFTDEEKMTMAAGFVAARVTKLMEKRFGVKAYPIPSLLQASRHHEILKAGSCQSYDLPKAPNDWVDLNRLIDQSYLRPSPEAISEVSGTYSGFQSPYDDAGNEARHASRQSLTERVRSWWSRRSA